MLTDQSIRYLGTLLNFVRRNEIRHSGNHPSSHPHIPLCFNFTLYVCVKFFTQWTSMCQLVLVLPHLTHNCILWLHVFIAYLHELLNNNYWKASAELVYKQTTQMHATLYSSELVSKTNEKCNYSSCYKIFIGPPMLYKVTEYDTVYSTKYQLGQGSQWSTIQTFL